ncbi:hypothetical protein ABLN87_20790 [Ruegeria sp. SCPT10]|uniref:hypothetical protein n=1 Tax=Ruegeria sp. SCP10 TaxID=3141377 RepID=UPI0033382706
MHRAGHDRRSGPFRPRPPIDQTQGQRRAAIYGGTDAATALISACEATDAADTILLGASSTDETAVMYQAPYYTREDRGPIPDYDNKFSALGSGPIDFYRAA